MREKAIVKLSEFDRRHIAYVSYYSSSEEDGECELIEKLTNNNNNNGSSSLKSTIIIDKDDEDGKKSITKLGISKNNISTKNEDCISINKNEMIIPSTTQIVKPNEKIVKLPENNSTTKIDMECATASTSSTTTPQKNTPPSNKNEYINLKDSTKKNCQNSSDSSLIINSPKLRQPSNSILAEAKNKTPEANKRFSVRDFGATPKDSIKKYAEPASPIVFPSTSTKEVEQQAPPIPSVRRSGLNRRISTTAPKRTSVLVLEDRPLPELPSDASDDEEKHFHLNEEEDIQNEEILLNENHDDDAIYINTRIPLPGRTSTNDSGLGGSTTAPQDYANAQIPLKATKVSQKIQQLLLTLQERRAAVPANNNRSYHHHQQHHHPHHYPQHQRHITNNNNNNNKPTLTQSQILSSTPNPSKLTPISSKFRYGPSGGQFTINSPPPTVNSVNSKAPIRAAIDEARRKVIVRSDRSPSYRGPIENKDSSKAASISSRHRSATRDPVRERVSVSNKLAPREKSLSRAIGVSPIASVEVKNSIINNCSATSSRLSRSTHLDECNNNIPTTTQQHMYRSNVYRSSNIPDVVPKINLTPKSPLTTKSGLFLDIRDTKSKHIVMNDLRGKNDSPPLTKKAPPKAIIQRAKSASRHSSNEYVPSKKYNSYDLDATIPLNEIENVNERLQKTSIKSFQPPSKALMESKAMTRSVMDSEDQNGIAKRSLQRRRRLRELEQQDKITFETPTRSMDSEIRPGFYNDYDDDVTDYDVADTFAEAGPSSSQPIPLNSSPTQFPLCGYKAILSVKPPPQTTGVYNFLNNNNRMANSVIRNDPYSKQSNENIGLSNQELQRTRRERSYRNCDDAITTFHDNKRLPLSLFNDNCKMNDAKLSLRREKAVMLSYDDDDDLIEPEVRESGIATLKKRIDASKQWREGALMRSKSQSRGPYEIMPSMSSTKTTEDIRKRQDAFLVSRSKTSHNLTSSTNEPSTSHISNAGPLLASWRSFSRLAHGSTNALNGGRSRAKTPQRLPLSDDVTAVLEIYDPVENDRRRENLMRNALLTANDSIGFDIVQQELKSFRHLKKLALGRTRVVKIADLPAVERLNAAEILKKYKLYLQRPKKKPLHEYYNDDDAELEAMAKIIDPNAPRPEGALITPARGDFPQGIQHQLHQQQSHPRSVDSILHRHGQTQPKTVAGVVLDHTGKANAQNTLTYGKLLSRASKIAYMLLNKQVTITTGGVKEKVHLCIAGDRVALVYPNTEPLAFLVAFYGCLLAGVVPVPIEVPLTKRDAGIQQFGFLLGSCGVRVALTTESCLKGLPKTGNLAATNNNLSANNNNNNLTSNNLNGAMSSPSNSIGNSGSGGTASAPFPTTTTGSGGSVGTSSGASGNYYNHFTASTNPNDVADFKGWPRLHWTVTENLSRPSRDWTLPSLLANDEHAYIEYTTDREGSVKGVCITRQSMLAHCRAIVAAMGYKEGETMISVLDFKRDVGLWHGVLAAIYCGMKVYFVPYSLMKINPTSWLVQATKLKAQTALVKSRDLHWSLIATRDHKELQLNTLRSIVVADGANPWSLSSCDQFLATFQPMGLNSTALCPCAGAPETGTLAIRRLPKEDDLTNNNNSRSESTTTPPSSGRGVLSMWALSHEVVRVDQENSLTSLTLQDAGQVLPGGMAVVIKPYGPAKLCKADEIGEICLHAPSTANCYFGLKGVSQQSFAVSPLAPDESPLGPVNYVRSGLIGFLGPEGLVFIIGNKSCMLAVSGRQHSADDLIATVLAVEPMKFIYRGRIAIFSVRVLRDERICVVAEQKPDVSEEDAFNWMVRVLQAVDSIHQVGIYCLALVGPNQLPKTPLGGIHVTETRQKFLDGCLFPTTLLMCPQNCVLNLPKPREQQTVDVGPAAMFVGNIVQGVRIAGAQGRELTLIPDEESIFLIDILRQRAQQTPEHVLYTLVNARGVEIDQLTCQQLFKKAERIGALLLDKGRLQPGDHVALIFPPGVELIASFYGCLSAGLVPVCIRAPTVHNLQASLITVRMVVDVSKAVALLSNSAMIKILKSKEASHRVNTKAWPTILDLDDMPSSSVARKRKNQLQEQQQLLANRQPNDTCYLDFSVSTTGQLAGIVITALGAATQCKSLKVACELYPSRNVALCLDPCCGLGFTLWCLSSVYSGHHSTLISPAEVEQNAAIWLNTLSQYKVRDTFCSYSVMEMCVRELAPQIHQLKDKGINLSSLRTCVAVAEERPRLQLCNAFIKLFAPLGLIARAVSTSFGSRVNTAICLQGAASPDPSILYVDARALRNDRVTLVEKGAPHSIPLMESGKLLPGVKVVIANPESKGQCADSHLGEIWVASGHNAAGYYSIFGEETHLHTDHFNARLRTGDTKTIFARTGYLGFLRQTQAITADGELHDAVFVVGALDETLILRGMRYHPVDIETTVIRSHKRICECAVFTWTHLLVVVAETVAPESEALDLVPAITSAVLEDHHLIVGVVMLIDPGAIPINSRGEKQRMHLRDSFLKDQLDPIYVAYNM